MRMISIVDAVDGSHQRHLNVPKCGFILGAAMSPLG
jgi:hypothetical protein